MRAVVILGLVAVTLAGCQKQEVRAAQPAGFLGFGGPKARYFGVGMYAPGELWRQLAGAKAAADPAAANLDDDDEIFVVLDSRTGELRQCGNFSGHCIGMNPWANPLDPASAAPAKVLKHATQLREEAEAAAKAAKPRIDVRLRPG